MTQEREEYAVDEALLAAGGVALVRVTRRLSLIVVRDDGGELRGFVNRCAHLPIPLDAGSGDFLSPDRTHLRCGTHGALFRREDGLCIAGPCAGQSLERAELRRDERDVLWVAPPPGTAR